MSVGVGPPAHLVVDDVGARHPLMETAPALVEQNPGLMILIMGERAQAFLPKARDWMNTNSWIVNELVLLLFVGIVISNIA